MNMAGNCINHPERIQPDRHTPGSPLPRANLHNSIGYLPDGTAMNAAGNALNHPERMQPDMHVSGSPLPKSVYYADAGYFADGTDLTAAGNNFAKAAAAVASPAPVANTSPKGFLGLSCKALEVTLPPNRCVKAGQVPAVAASPTSPATAPASAFAGTSVRWRTGKPFYSVVYDGQVDKETFFGWDLQFCKTLCM